MKEVFEYKIEKMFQNYEELKKGFVWEGDISKHLVALTHMINVEALSIKKMKDLISHIKTETTAFSNFRGSTMFTISGLICSNSNSEIDFFNSMLSNHKIMKSTGFKNSMFLPSALYTLSSIYDGNDVEGFCVKAMDIYLEMKKNHPFLTGGDDYALALLLARTGQNPDLLEEYYTGLSQHGFTKTNGLQLLSHILAFSTLGVDKTIEKCEKIHTILKKNKLKVFSDHYSAIGIISLIENENNDVLDDLMEIAKYLNKHKKYKWLGKGMNIFIASAIVVSEYTKNDSSDTNELINISIQTIIAAQQAVMIGAIGVTSAAGV